MTDFSPREGMTDEVLFARDGALGRVRLNRPRAINALTTGMVVAVHDQLQQWAHDDTVTAVLLDGAGERGLCSGGDVRWVRERIVAGEPDEALGFFEAEYRMNALIASYPKPYVALMTGVVMGGGLGISAHGSVRVATETTKVAMPETAIGFHPDVGITHLLARAPGQMGLHLALTGMTVSGQAARELGLVDVVVDEAALPALVGRLRDGEVPTLVTLHEQYATVLGTPLDGHREWIDEAYVGDDAVTMLERLRESDEPGAAEAAGIIELRSPLSVWVAMRAVHEAERQGVGDVLAADLEKARATMTNPDFVEGVRAVLVDKTSDAVWQHASLADVPADAVRRFFPGR